MTPTCALNPPAFEFGGLAGSRGEMFRVASVGAQDNIIGNSADRKSPLKKSAVYLNFISSTYRLNLKIQ